MSVFSITIKAVFLALMLLLTLHFEKPKLNYPLTFIIMYAPLLTLLTVDEISGVRSYLTSAAIYLTYLVLVITLFRGKTSRKLIFSSVTIIITLFVCTIYLVQALFRRIANPFFLNDKIGAVVSLSVIIILEILFVRYYKSKSEPDDISEQDFLRFLLLPISQIVLCIAIHKLYSSILFASSSPALHSIQEDVSIIIMMVCIVAFFISDIFVYRLLLRVSENAQLKQKLKGLEARDQMNMEYFEKLEKSNLETRKIRHDLANALEIARCMEESNSPASKEAAGKILDNMERELENTRIERYCENALINTIMTNAVNECKEKGIDIEYDINVPKDVNSNKFDAIRIITNLLNNAVFAAEHSESKKIKVAISYINNCASINIVNPCAKHITRDDGKEHGYGLKIVNDIAKKYGGEFEYYEKDGLFFTRACAIIEEAEKEKE